MSRPALPEERGADLQPDPPTLDELRDEHAFEQEDRDLYEPGDGARSVDVCQDCGLEQDARDRGKEAPCPNKRIPSHLIETAKRHGLLPETAGAREDSMASGEGSTSVSPAYATEYRGLPSASSNVISMSPSGDSRTWNGSAAPFASVAFATGVRFARAIVEITPAAAMPPAAARTSRHPRRSESSPSLVSCVTEPHAHPCRLKRWEKSE